MAELAAAMEVDRFIGGGDPEGEVKNAYYPRSQLCGVVVSGGSFTAGSKSSREDAGPARDGLIIPLRRDAFVSPRDEAVVSPRSYTANTAGELVCEGTSESIRV
jgi:hypothetical protein